MFELIDYKPEHAMEVVANGVIQPDLKFSDKVQPWAESLAEFPCTTGVYDGRIVGCGGLIIHYEKHRAEAWALYVDDMGKLHIDPKIIRNQLHDWIIDNELVRIEAPLRADFKAGFSYARYLGFEQESEQPMRKYHPDGVDAYMHVIVR